MPYASLGDLELYYEIHGTGTPLLLVPGLNGTFSFWREQIAPFAEHFQVIVHDHRGTGRSTHSLIRYSIEQMTCNASSHTALDSLDVYPKASTWYGEAPRPVPKSTRPSDTTSRVDTYSTTR